MDMAPSDKMHSQYQEVGVLHNSKVFQRKLVYTVYVVYLAVILIWWLCDFLSVRQIQIMTI